MSSRNSSRKEGINVRDEREFKLWVKFILSIQKDGGDIKKNFFFLKMVQSFADRLKRPMTEKIEFGFPYVGARTMLKSFVLDQSVK